MALLGGLLSFYAVCSIGALTNVGVAHLLNDRTGLVTLPSMAGAVISALWNFIVSSIVTWRTRDL